MDKLLPKEISEKLPINNLTQILVKEAESGNYVFLGFGNLGLHYDVEVVKGDSMAATLAGCDHNYVLKRNGLDSCNIDRKVPEKATHYCLQRGFTDEELYLNHKENSYSTDVYPIIFLKNIKEE